MAALKILSAFFTVLLMFGEGFAGCEDATLTMQRTGAIVKGQPEYEVSIINNCPCRLSHISYNISDFNSVEPVDPAILRKYSGIQYIVNNLQPIPRPPKPPLKFKYAQAHPATFKPATVLIGC